MLDPVCWITEKGHIFKTFEPELTNQPGKLRLIDQTLLPQTLEYIELDCLDDIFDAIKRLAVRGAPAIGCAAALGLAAVCKKSPATKPEEFINEVNQGAAYLAKSRPTAVNLFWALERCTKAASTASNNRTVADLKVILLREAMNILTEDIEMCRAIGRNGSVLLKNNMGVLTHCNAGALATGDYGTALSPIYVAQENDIKVKVYSDETRPLLQGSRLTAWELDRAGVDVTIICDNMAAQVMREGKIDIVIVGADRIAANGDTANKIGTYGVAIAAKYHNIPFYVAAPYSTLDVSLADGSGIPIEQRSPDEIINGFGRRTGPESANVYNPSFDVTPHELITGFITERGIITPPFIAGIAKLTGAGQETQK